MKAVVSQTDYIEKEMNRIESEYSVPQGEPLPEEIVIRFAYEFEKHHPDDDPVKQQKNIQELLVRYEIECIENMQKSIQEKGIQTDEQIAQYQALSLKKAQIKL